MTSVLPKSGSPITAARTPRVVRSPTFSDAPEDETGLDDGTTALYGFAVYLASYLAFALFLVWAYLPEHILERWGITYYPDRWWALAVPSWIVVLVPTIVVVFAAKNLSLTLPSDSVYTITDEKAVLMPHDEAFRPYEDPEGHPELRDLPIGVVNKMLYS